MHKTVSIFTAFILLLSGLSACTTGAHELDERAYVYTIGIDKGVSDKLRFTFQFPTLSPEQDQSSGGPGSSKQAASDLATITIDCPTIYSGVAMIYSSYSRRLSFMHTKYLIISEEVARESVEPFINGMTRSAEIRRTMYVIVCKGKASDFVSEFRPFAGSSVSKSQELLMENADYSGLYESVIYNKFAVYIKCTKCQATATLAALNDFSSFREDGAQEESFKSEGDYYPGEVPRKGENKFEFMGTALFNGATMVGELNGNETRAMQMIRGEFKKSEIVIPDPTDQSLRIGSIVFQQRKPDVEITFENGEPRIHVTVFLEGALQNAQGTQHLEKEYKTRTEEAFAAFIKEKLDQTVSKCQELGVEVFYFGYKASMQFWTIQEWEAYGWLSHFKEAQVTTEVEFILRRTGTLIATEEEKRTGW